MLRHALLACCCLLATAPFAAAQDPDEAAVAAVARVLDTKHVSLDFQDTPVPTVVRYLAEATGLNIVIDAMVREELEVQDARVNLQLAEVTARTALDVLCDFFSLRHAVRGTVLFITSPERAAADGVLRAYDVRDLLVVPRDHTAPLRDLLAAAGGERAEEIELETAELQPDELVEMIKGTIEPDSWDVPGTSICYVNGTCLIRAAAEVHAEIARLLEGLRALGHTRVVVEIQVVDLDAATARSLRLGTALPPALDTAAEQLLATAIGSGTARRGAAATLTGFNTQRVTLRDGAQHRLPRPGAAGTVVVQDGLTVDVRPVLVAGRDAIHCTVNAQIARLQPITGAHPHPTLDVVTVHSAVVGPLDRWCWLGSGTMGAATGAPAPARETCILARISTPGEDTAPARRDALPRHAPAPGAGVRARLSRQRVSPSFENTPLTVVLAFFRDLSDVNLVLDRRVFDDRPDESLLVSLQLHDVSADEALQLVLELTGLALAERPEFGLITLPEWAAADTALAVYDIRDLVLPATDHVVTGPDLTATPGGPNRPGVEEDALEPLTSDQLADLIRETIATESWDTPPNSLEPKVGLLIARNRPEVLVQVDRLLGRLRAITTRTVLVEALHVVVDQATWEAAHLGRVLTPEQAELVARRAAAGEGMRLGSVARVAGLNAQQFTIHAGRQLAAEDAVQGSLIAAEGLVLQVRPVVTSDGHDTYCDLVLRLQHTAGASGLAGGLDAEEIRTTAKVPAGGAVVLGGFAVGDRPGSLTVLRVTPAR